jgi:hypothetical protein
MSEQQIDINSDNAQLIVALASARAAIDSLLVALAKGPAATEAPSRVVIEGSAPPDMPVECQHHDRQTIAGFGTSEHWICNDCGYEYIRR